MRGAIDGIEIFDFKDSSTDNNGPVFHHGHLAIRCMMRTDVVFRNLAVKTRPAWKLCQAAGAY